MTSEAPRSTESDARAAPDSAASAATSGPVWLFGRSLFTSLRLFLSLRSATAKPHALHAIDATREHVQAPQHAIAATLNRTPAGTRHRAGQDRRARRGHAPELRPRDAVTFFRGCFGRLSAARRSRRRRSGLGGGAAPPPVVAEGDGLLERVLAVPRGRVVRRVETCVEINQCVRCR